MCVQAPTHCPTCLSPKLRAVRVRRTHLARRLLHRGLLWLALALLSSRAPRAARRRRVRRELLGAKGLLALETLVGVEVISLQNVRPGHEPHQAGARAVHDQHVPPVVLRHDTLHLHVGGWMCGCVGVWMWGVWMFVYTPCTHTQMHATHHLRNSSPHPCTSIPGRRACPR